MCIELVDKFFASWKIEPRELLFTMLESEYFIDVFDQHKFLAAFLQEWKIPTEELE